MHFAFFLVLATFLTGCSSLLPGQAEIAPGQDAWASASNQPEWKSSAHGAASPIWRHHALPGKSATLFSFARHDGRDAVAAVADASASLWRRKVRIEPVDLEMLRFSWHVPALIEGADMGRRDADDSPARVVLAFEGDRSRFSQRDVLLSELALTLTGEPLPYATLMYVWCNTRPVGTVIASPRTDRIRKLVVESGPSRLSRWVDHERDIGADFERAFGEKPGVLTGVALMSDTDNTRAKAQAWYGPVRLVPYGAGAGQPPGR